MTGGPRLREAGELGDLGEGLERRRNRRLVADERLGHRAEIALVIPDVVISRENALSAFAVEIEPLVLPAVDVGWQVGEARGIDLLHVALNDGRGIGQVERRQGALEVGSVALADIAGLRHGRDEGRGRAFGIGEFRAPDQIVRRAELVGEMMEHQDLTAQPIGADVEAGAIARERILPRRPGLRGRERGCYELTSLRVGGKRRRVALAVVEHGLEQPGLLRKVRLRRRRQRIAVFDALEVAVGGAARFGAIALVVLQQIDVRRSLPRHIRTRSRCLCRRGSR